MFGMFAPPPTKQYGYGLPPPLTRQDTQGLRAGRPSLANQSFGQSGPMGSSPYVVQQQRNQLQDLIASLIKQNQGAS